MHVHANCRYGNDLGPAINMVSGYLLRDVATFGENLKRIRKAAKLKAKEVAARVGVRPPVVSGWENDRTGLPETPTLLKLAKAIPCTIEDLLEGVDPEYDRVRARIDLARHTGTGVSGLENTGEPETAQHTPAGAHDQDEGPMREALRSVREALGESMAKLIDVEDRLSASRQTADRKASGARIRGNRR